MLTVNRFTLRNTAQWSPSQETCNTAGKMPGLSHFLARFVLVSSLVFVPNFAWSAMFDHTMLTELKKKYGKRAHQRGVDFQELLAKLKRADTRTQLKEINDFFNAFSYHTDQDFWGKEDHWATPTEFIGRYGGDCEDFVISKYLALRSLGISDEKLFLAYARLNTQNGTHMVLKYRETPQSVPLILDNRVPGLMPVSQRRDLQLMHTFNLGSRQS
jgi:predicted transglutaminase-like cysteine proteinase